MDLRQHDPFDPGAPIGPPAPRMRQERALRSREVAGWFTLPLRRSEPTGRCERGFCPVEGMPSPDSCSTRLGPGSLK